MSPLEECCYICEAHDGRVCRDNESERSAAERVCDGCFETADIDELRDRLMGWGAA